MKLSYYSKIDYLQTITISVVVIYHSQGIILVHQFCKGNIV